MLKRLILVIPVAAVAGWYVVTHYELKGLEGLGLPGSSANRAAEGDPRPDLPPPAEGKRTIRIATFNVDPLDPPKVANRIVAGHLVSVVRRFDIVALQNIQSEGTGLLSQLIEQVNADGRHFQFAVGPVESGLRDEPYSAFVYDMSTVEIDPSTVCLVDDPLKRLRHRPLVAAFRTRGPQPSEAFTFTLINARTSLDRAAQELDLMDDVYRAVRDDGRNEDDVILLGDLNADEPRLLQWQHAMNLTWAIARTPSTMRGTRPADNVLFDRRATIEYTGRSGVFDVMRELELTVEQAAELSDHLPVWAEFSVYEGGEEGRVAVRPP